MTIDLSTRYQATWAEINAKVISRQNAQNVFVAAVATVMALVLGFQTNSQGSVNPWARALLASMPALVAFVFMAWVLSLDRGISLLSQACRHYEALDESDGEQVPKWFAKDQEWRKEANELRILPGVAQALVSLPTLLPPVILWQESGNATSVAVSLCVAGLAILLAFIQLIRALTYRRRLVNLKEWNGAE